MTTKCFICSKKVNSEIKYKINEEVLVLFCSKKHYEKFLEKYDVYEDENDKLNSFIIRKRTNNKDDSLNWIEYLKNRKKLKVEKSTKVAISIYSISIPMYFIIFTNLINSPKENFQIISIIIFSIFILLMLLNLVFLTRLNLKKYKEDFLIEKEYRRLLKANKNYIFSDDKDEEIMKII